MKYELGHYDEEMLAELGGSTEVFDDVIGKWKDQPALKQMVNAPWYGFEDTCSLHSKVLGCSINVNFLPLIIMENLSLQRLYLPPSKASLDQVCLISLFLYTER